MIPDLICDIRRRGGFTLIELMVTIAVLAIVISIAAPSFNNMIVSNRLASLGDDLLGSINLARSEAVKRSTRVSICASINGTSCATATDWSKGWIVFVDNAVADNTTTPTIGTVLSYSNKLDPKTLISFKKGSASSNFIRFNSRGALTRIALTQTPAVFQILSTGCKGNVGRTLTINLAGMVTPAAATCSP